MKTAVTVGAADRDVHVEAGDEAASRGQEYSSSSRRYRAASLVSP